MTPAPCDCINWCGDDPWLPDGRAIPCERLKKRQADDAAADKRAEERIALCKAWGVTDTDNLVIRMQEEIERLQADLQPEPEPGELCPRCAALEFNRVSGFGDLTP